MAVTLARGNEEYYKYGSPLMMAGWTEITENHAQQLRFMVQKYFDDLID